MADQAHHASPKIDLHRHLEGSLRLETLHELSSRYKLDELTAIEQLRASVQIRPGDARTPENLLAKFRVIRRFFKDPEVIGRFVHETIEDAASDGIKVLELRFTPAAIQPVSNLPLADIIEAVCVAGQEAAKLHNLQLGLIVSVNRHEPLEQAERVLHLAADRIGNGVRGVDLAGDENAVALDPFIPLFKEAKQAGLKLTIHAGEWGGAENILRAIEEIGADRIGHGVRVMEDPGVLHIARTSGVGFEISPSSNILTGIFDDYTSHSLPSMIDAGLKVAITTDDPSIFGTTLTREHEITIQYLGLSRETIKGLTLQAIQISFFDEKEKRALELMFAEDFWG